ncbi:PHP14 phosphatase, partial [Syrrhaptes paradoxus]|nr:PHP14 phosphatase [Syrrhaptes paradoxus]
AMAAAVAEALSRVPDVEIDGDGVFKYVLVRVRAAGGPGKDVVRGHGWAEYHGEGRGGHGPGHAGGSGVPWGSRGGPVGGFGRADHSVTTEKLKAEYPDYEITWADEGY